MPIFFKSRVLIPAFLLVAVPAAAQNSVGNIYGNQEIITQGQTGNNTIIQGFPARHLSDPDKTEMLSRIPKNRRIVIIALWGDQEVINLGAEIKAFLARSGYTSIDGVGWGVMTMPDGTSFKGISVNLNEDKLNMPVQINVGAAR